MAKEYIERDAFLAGQRHLYCENCERRKGMKNGKMKFVYAIGEAPCRACDIGDMLDSIEGYPAADVAPVRRGRWLCVDPDTEQFFLCNRCKKKEYWESDYCPNCGCRMDGGVD